MFRKFQCFAKYEEGLSQKKIYFSKSLQFSMNLKSVALE
jgi:hypothetical protein